MKSSRVDVATRRVVSVDAHDASAGPAGQDPSRRTSEPVAADVRSDASSSEYSETRRGEIDARRICAWCEGEIPATARIDAIYCSKRCRQASHRFRRGCRPRPEATDRAMLFAYADPPYPGTARKYYRDHHDFAGEVDHKRLVEQLSDEFPDGWALSTSARSLQEVLGYSPAGVRVGAWFRGARPSRSGRPLVAWEPVVFAGGRYVSPGAGATRRLDALTKIARPRLTDPHRVTGAKPADFLWWLFDLLGARPGDELVDLFPGSGGVSRAWKIFTDGPPAVAARADDASPVPGLHDASISGRGRAARRVAAGSANDASCAAAVRGKAA